MDLTKDINSEVKELDEEKGYVEAIANAYNHKDSDGDISHPSSFVKTVSEGFKKLRVYKNHNTNIVVGVPKMLDPNHKDGLYTGTQFNMEKGSEGRNMFYDVKMITDNKQDADLSIGYRVIRRDPNNKSIVTEYQLKEYSFLTSWGANDRSIVSTVKTLKTEEEIIEHLTKMYNLPYTDSRLIQVEKILKSLALAPSENTQIVEPIKSIYSLLALK